MARVQHEIERGGEDFSPNTNTKWLCIRMQYLSIIALSFVASFCFFTMIGPTIWAEDCYIAGMGEIIVRTASHIPRNIVTKNLDDNFHSFFRFCF
mmetsp:Transcript_12492/g.27009  ORF Transcript_12492/g.27009 Transcript_12492/m.27009 type:complete len:95 (+) Transcript_12492:412-696(+)